MAKRKISYEQSLALERARAVARRNQRQRRAEREASPTVAVEHEHRYGDWTSLFLGHLGHLQHGSERRYCECGALPVAPGAPLMTRPPMKQRREVAAEITTLMRPLDAPEEDGRGAFAKRDTSILVVYGHGRGDFQTLSFAQAMEYLRCLEDGDEGPPWKLGIR